MEKLKCISCKRPITNDPGAARFPCPNCAKTEIIRCRNCRTTAMKYTCISCGFEGPN